MADMAVREAADDLTALSVLTEYARTEGCRMRQRLHQTISQGEKRITAAVRLKLSASVSYFGTNFLILARTLWKHLVKIQAIT